MQETVSQQALKRVLAYLRDEGRELDADTLGTALRLVNETQAYGDGKDLPAQCMDRIPDYFGTQVFHISASGLPLERGHIGYYPND